MNLSELRELYQRPGPWASVYVDASSDTADAGRRVDLAARAVTQAVEETAAEVVILAGDIRARQLLAEHLPPAVTRRLVETEAGARAAGADPTPLDEAVERTVDDLVTRRHDEVLDRFRAGLPDGLAVTGRSAVRRALAWGQVDTVLLDVDPSDEDAEELVASAAGIDADLVVVGPDAGLSERVGAV